MLRFLDNQKGWGSFWYSKIRQTYININLEKIPILNYAASWFEIAFRTTAPATLLNFDSLHSDSLINVFIPFASSHHLYPFTKFDFLKNFEHAFIVSDLLFLNRNQRTFRPKKSAPSGSKVALFPLDEIYQSFVLLLLLFCVCLVFLIIGFKMTQEYLGMPPNDSVLPINA